jgi:rod shape-determining protein MreD
MQESTIRAYLTIPILGIIAVFQSTLLPHLRIWGVFPNLMLVVVVSWSLLRGADQGLVWAFVGGALIDVLSGGPMGVATLSLMAVAFLAGIGEVNIFRTHVALPLAAVLLSTLLYGLLILLALQLTGQTVDWTGSMMSAILPSAVVNTLLTPVIYVTIHWLHRHLGRAAVEL